MKNKAVPGIMLTLLLTSLILAAFGIREASASPTVRIYVDMPLGYIPGVPPGPPPSGFVFVDLYIDTDIPDNTPQGIVQWAISVQVDPTVLEPMGVQGAQPGYFLYDFLERYGYNWMGYSTFLLPPVIDKEAGIMEWITEGIIGFPPIANGAGGSGKLCTLVFLSRSETDYSPIHLFYHDGIDPLYWTAESEMTAFPVGIVEGGHYNPPAPPIYIRADGSVEPDTANIVSVDNVTYTFTHNIYDEIVVEKDNIIVDGVGFTLQVTRNAKGVDLTGRSNVTIKNMKIDALFHGIYLRSSSNNNIIGNNATANYGYGVWLDSSSNNTVSGNNITNSYDGIRLNSSSNNTVSENNITNNENGIRLWSSCNNTIYGNNATANNWRGIGLYGASYNSIVGNNITNNEYGVWLDSSSSNTVSKNNVTNNEYGVWLDSSSSNTVSKNNVTNNEYGVWLDSSSNNTVSENNITNNWYGVELSSSSNNTVYGNNVTNNEYGVWLYGSSNNALRNNEASNNTYNFGVGGESLSQYVHDVDDSNTVNGKPVYYWVTRRDMTVPLDAGYVALINCTHMTTQNLNLTNNAQGVLLVSTTDSTIAKNNITNNGYGISLHGSSNNTVSGNNVTNSYDGVWLDSSSNNTVSENNITNNRYGMSLHGSSNNTVSENNVTANNWKGIQLEWSSDCNTVSGNNIANNGYGVWLLISSNNMVSENNVTDNGSGVELWSSSNNTVSRNNVTNNYDGIRLNSSSNNTVYGNNVTNNEYGVWLDSSSSNTISKNNVRNNGCGIQLNESSNNTVYHNNFVDNPEQVYCYESTNVWDDGYPSGGNYWSDHVTVDDCCGINQDEPGSDGIVDEPYVIDEDNCDNYPLVEPWSPVISAVIDVDPDTLTLRSVDKWITCFIELPEGYNASDIDVSTVMLNDTIPVSLLDVPAPEPVPTEIGDHDNDTILDLMVKSDRAMVSEFILSKGITYGIVTLAVAGELFDGTPFEGSDSIRVISPSTGSGGCKGFKK